MRKRATMVLAGALMLAALPVAAQQRPDPQANVAVSDPAFSKGMGPIVGIDSGHREFQTIASGYSTFAALLTNDGYRLQDFDAELTPANLAEISILVIADPRSATPPVSKLPIDEPSAFSDAEIATLHNWVASGGALLICADHPPFAGSLRALAGSFGFTINRYAARVSGWPQTKELFNRANGGLIDGPLTRNVDQVETFFGTAFTAPAEATALLKLDSTWVFQARGLPPIPASSNDWRGATIAVGKGRFVLMAEAGELSAQISVKDQPMGFNAPAATGNKQFVRNIVRWLATGSVGEAQPTQPKTTQSLSEPARQLDGGTTKAPHSMTGAKEDE